MIGLSTRVTRNGVPLCLALLLFGAASGAAGAEAIKVPTGTHARTTVATFRLQLSGAPAPGTTFWVAYGPLAGRFGLIQLRATGAGMYQAQRRLPADGRTTFVYLAGQGMVRTRYGWEPGDPVVTIRSFGPTTAAEAGRRLVRWQPPAG